MWPQPDDPRTARRMRAAHGRARAAMGMLPGQQAREAWGWRGRTLGGPVTAPDGPAWLRVVCAPASQAATIFWNGAIEAEKFIPPSVPRPRLRSWHDWNNDAWQYRAELYDHLNASPAASSPALTADPALPAQWWVAARSALGLIAAVPTRRTAVCQPFLDRAMPRLLGTPISTTAPGPWTTAHGDFHFANICAPDFRVLDFEGWGLAPAGYDAATIHAHSLLIPSAAARVRRELARELDSKSGRFAELVVITELLHAATRGDYLALAEPLRRRAADLLGRSVPGSRAT